MTGMRSARCVECDAEYRTSALIDATLCPHCEARERGAYAASYADDSVREPFYFSRAAMRERLGVSGDVDE